MCVFVSPLFAWFDFIFLKLFHIVEQQSWIEFTVIQCNLKDPKPFPNELWQMALNGTNLKSVSHAHVNFQFCVFVCVCVLLCVWKDNFRKREHGTFNICSTSLIKLIHTHWTLKRRTTNAWVSFIIIFVCYYYWRTIVVVAVAAISISASVFNQLMKLTFTIRNASLFVSSSFFFSSFVPTFDHSIFIVGWIGFGSGFPSLATTRRSSFDLIIKWIDMTNGQSNIIKFCECSIFTIN